MSDYNPTHEEQFQHEPADAVLTVEPAQAEEHFELQEQATPSQPVVKGAPPLNWLDGEVVEELQSRWNALQIEFVDDPHKSVEQADALVADALKQIELALTNQRSILSETWINHEGISTEDLRVALRGYRAFLNRLLAL